MSMSLWVEPVSYIHFTICIDHSTSTIDLVIFPISFKNRTIQKSLDTFTVTFSFFIPLSFIDSPVLDNNCILPKPVDILNTRRCRLVVESTEFVFYLTRETWNFDSCCDFLATHLNAIIYSRCSKKWFWFPFVIELHASI